MEWRISALKLAFKNTQDHVSALDPLFPLILQFSLYFAHCVLQQLQQSRLNVLSLLPLTLDLLWYLRIETILNYFFNFICLLISSHTQILNSLINMWHVALECLFKNTNLLEPLFALINYVLAQALAPVLNHVWQLALKFFSFRTFFLKVSFDLVWKNLNFILSHLL